EVREVKLNKTQNPQAGIILFFDSKTVVGDDNHPALIVADTLCSGFGYPTGYLFESLRGEGLVYDVNAYVMPGRSAALPGAFIVYAVCDPKNAQKVIDGILLQMARLQSAKKEDLVLDWPERAKTLIVTAAAL